MSSFSTVQSVVHQHQQQVDKTYSDLQLSPTDAASFSQGAAAEVTKSTTSLVAYPMPTAIALQQAINPVAQLLLSFPAPSFTAPTCLSTGPSPSLSASSTQGCERTGETVMEGLTKNMINTAQSLIASSRFTHYLQEEFHRETAAATAVTHSAQSSPNHASSSRSSVLSISPERSRATAPGQAKEEATSSEHQKQREPTLPLEQEVAAAMKRLLSKVASTTTITRPSSLDAARAKPSSSWTPSTEGHMTLRPRHIPTKPEPKSEDETPATTRRASNGLPSSRNTVAARAQQQRERATYSSAASAAPLLFSSSALTLSLEKADAFCRESVVREAIEQCTLAVPTLQAFILRLPLDLQPFKGIDADKIAKFLSFLVAVHPDSATTSSAAGRCQKVDSDEADWGQAVRGLTCCLCLAHPALDASVVPEGVMDGAITLFTRAVRGATQSLASMEAAAAALLASSNSNEEHVGGTAQQRRRHVQVRWLELLRSYLKAFAAILCNPTLSLVSDTDASRLEDLCFQCLFTVPHRGVSNGTGSSKGVYACYTAYVMNSGLHLYRCIWNRLHVQRQHTAETFFARLLVSDLLTIRSMNSGVSVGGATPAASGTASVHVMPFTLAVLSAAQSIPLYAEPLTPHSAERLQQQCGAWAASLLQTFLSPRDGAERAENDARWVITIQFLEDLVALLGSPEWPASDVLLRTCVLALSHLCLGGGANSHAAERLRPLAVDCLARVAFQLFGRSASSIPACGELGVAAATSLSNTTTTAEVEGDNVAAATMASIIESAGEASSSAVRYRWTQSLTASTGGAGGVGASGGENCELSPVEMLQAMMYNALSAHVDASLRAGAADIASAWSHSRTAHLFCWILYGYVEGSAANAAATSRPTAMIEAAIDGLARGVVNTDIARSSAATDVVGLDVLQTWCLAYSAHSPRSMLSAKMRKTVVSLLLSVFHLRDSSTGADIAVSDVVLKKALQHLATLTSLYAPLHPLIWSIARQCVRDDSARIRESIVPLLVTLLSSITGTSKTTTNTKDEGTGQQKRLSPDNERLAADVVSSLLHLLEDRSVAVVTRTIHALDTVLTERQFECLLSIRQGRVLLPFIQNKLLVFVTPSAEPKHRLDVTRHFIKRWAITLFDAEVSVTGAHEQLTKELTTLTTLGSPTFPHEIITEEHPLVLLLRSMLQTIQAEEKKRVMAGSKYRRTKYTVEAQQLDHVMKSAARTLWSRFHAFASPEDAIACLATLHVLSLVDPRWVESLLDVLLHCLEYPLLSQPQRQRDVTLEYTGAVILQSCRILHTTLAGPSVPVVSLNQLARAFTALLAKYIGPYQQRIIVSACGALCAMITCGATSKLSEHINQAHLLSCYALMNTYYTRAKALVPGLAPGAPQERNAVAYVLRFFFLLSEFLRQYAGWKKFPNPHLASDNPALIAACGNTPSTLATGKGICENVYDLVESALRVCDEATRQKLNIIALRLLGSLCVLEPTVYFYRCEAAIHAALEDNADVAHQTQGLMLIRDFLGEEDARVDLAAKLTTRLNTAAIIAGSSANEVGEEGAAREEEEKSTGARKRTRTASKKGKRYKTLSPALHAAHPLPPQSESLADEDQNSGMSTWIMQKFHDRVVALCSSSSLAIRQLCLEVLSWCSQSGLLPPAKYLDAVIALGADASSPSVRQRALRCLEANADRDEQVIASRAPRGVLRAFDMHCACGVNLLQSAFVTNASGVATSIHAAVYGLLHKRLRAGLVASLLRVLYQETKARAWCADHRPSAHSSGRVASEAEGGEAGDESAAAVFRESGPAVLLAHLTATVAFLPFATESEAVHVLQQCRIGMDLNGQTSLDAVAQVLAAAEKSKAGSAGDGARESGSNRRSSTGGARRQSGHADTLVEVVGVGDGTRAAEWPMPDEMTLWKCCGAVMLHYLSRTLCAEFRLTPAKLRRYVHSTTTGAGAGTGSSAVALPAREARSKASATLLASLGTFVRHTHVLFHAPILSSNACDVYDFTDPQEKGRQESAAMRSRQLDAIRFLHCEMEAALAEESLATMNQLGDGANDLAVSTRLARRRGRPSTRLHQKQQQRGSQGRTAKRPRKSVDASAESSLGSIPVEEDEDEDDEEIDEDDDDLEVSPTPLHSSEDGDDA